MATAGSAEGVGNQDPLMRLQSYVDDMQQSDAAENVNRDTVRVEGPYEGSPDDDDDAEEQPEADEAEGSEASEAEASESDTEEGEAEPDEGPAEAEDDEIEGEYLEFTHPDGSTVRVAPDEYAEGYLRVEDYTRKTQALGHERREFQNRVQEWEAQKAQEAELLAQFQTQRPEYDPDDPFGSYQRQQEWDAENAKRTQFIQQQRARQAQARQQMLQEEQARLMRALPEWRDPKVRAAEQAEMVQIATEVYGFRPEEVEGILDHRAVRILRDAVKGRKSQAQSATVKEKVKEKVKKAPPKKPVKPGAAAKPKAGGDPRKARLVKQFRHSGKAADAAAVLMEDMRVK